MSLIDKEDKKQEIFKYGKYVILILIILSIFLIFRGCGNNYNDIESAVIVSAKKYISDNNINVNGELYIELTKLDEIEGTELCSKASGVIVTNNNGTLKYQPYLRCQDYQTEILDNSDKYISLNGEEVILLNKDEVFNDPMYVLNKEADVQISGVVGTSVGVYTITYNAYVAGELKETVSRKIIVTGSDKTQNISGIEDTQRPTITLYGDKNMTLSLGQEYKEPGYTAVDYEDGKLSRKVVKNGKVNENVIGVYTITYSVTNSKGNTAIAVRVVKVVQNKSNLTINISNNAESIVRVGKITLTVSGEGYNYTILPNGSKNYLKTITTEAYENKIYTFKIYDIYGNEFIKEIEITNIDNILPTGTCAAKVSNTKTEIEVIANDNKGISGYSYIIDGTATEYKTENFYNTNSSSIAISVDVKDIVENTSKLICTITIVNTGGSGGSNDNDTPRVDELPDDPNATLTKEKFNNSNGEYLRYFLYVPSVAESESVPLIVYLHGDGEKGDNLDDTSSVSIPKYLKRGTDFNAIIIAPQIKSGTNWYNESIEEQLKELIDYVANNYNVNTSKIILTGHSSGAIGTWHMAARYQNYFSCVVPLSYGDTNNRQATSLASELTNIPIRGYVGENDGSRERMQQLVDAINDLGGSAELIVLDGKSHIIQDSVYLNTDIFDWMYSQ